MATFIHQYPPRDTVEQQTATTGTAQSVRKRRHRITLACSNCRGCKARCDGRRPACSRCERRRSGDSCVYEEGALKTQSYVSALESRLKALEGERSSNIWKDIEPTSDLKYSKENSSSSLSPQPHQNEARSSSARQNPPPESARSTRNSNDALGIGSSLERSLDDEHPYISSFSKSVITYLGVLNDRLDSQLNVFDKFHQQATHVDKTMGPLSNLLYNPYGCTTRNEADHYVQCFWDNIHPLFPIIYKPLFKKGYERLWSSSPSEEYFSLNEDPVFLSMAYIVFAIGCKFSDLVPVTRRLPLAHHFYCQSQAVFVFDILEVKSVLEVQLLLLTAIYLQPTEFATRCWNVVGMAIRAAQALGLHLETPSGSSENQLQREMRLRIWHSCIIFDRLLALLFNRPVTIVGIDKPPLPELIDDEYLMEDGIGKQPIGVDPHIAPFGVSIELFDILGDEISTVHSIYTIRRPNHACEVFTWTTQALQNVLKLDSRLDSLLESVPGLTLMSLQLQRKSKGNKLRNLQLTILYMRSLFIRFFLMRPVLLYFTLESRRSLHNKHPNLSKLEQEISLKVAAKCISTVHTFVKLKYDDITSIYSISPCGTVNYIFDAAVALAAARVSHVTEPGFDEFSLKTSWARCLKILEIMKPQDKQAAYALNVMEYLDFRVEAANEDRALKSVAPDLIKEMGENLVDSQESILQGLVQNTSFVPNLTHLELMGSETFDESWFFDQVVDLDWLDT